MYADCDKRERERADKALSLNSGLPYSPDSHRLLEASSKKPTIRIKRLSFNGPGIRLKGASSIQNQLQKEREKAEKALRLNNIV